MDGRTDIVNTEELPAFSYKALIERFIESKQVPYPLKYLKKSYIKYIFLNKTLAA